MHKLLKQLGLLCLALVSFSLPACAQSQGANVGKKLPEAKLVYVSNEVSPSGKPLLLEFWATWCGPCRVSIPHLNEVYSKYKDKGLVVVGVSDEKPAVIRAFMEKVPMTYSVATDESGTLLEKLGIRGIPTAFLVSKDGTILWEGHPMNLKEAEIEKLLK